jgi:hypothetical protein
MEMGRYRRSSSFPCWLQRRSLAGSSWGRTAPSRGFKTAAAEEIFRAVYIAFKTDLLCLMLRDCHESRPIGTCERWRLKKPNGGGVVRVVAMDEEERRRSSRGGEIDGGRDRYM